MTLLAVGRVFDGYDVAPSAMSWNGDQLSLSGPIYIPVAASSRFALLTCVRDRVRSLVNSDDERHVPVTFTLDPALDGFYRPLSASISFEAYSPEAALGQWSMTLERLGRGALPQVEVHSNYAHIDPSNALSATEANVEASATAIAISACPSTAYDAWNGFNPASGTARVAESGTLSMFETTFPGLPFTAIHRFSVAPADGYVGACSIKGTYAGVADQLCLGDMAPARNGLVISNGLVRAKITSAALTVEVYDSGSWVTTSATGWTMVATSGTIGANTIDLSAADTVAVLRNSPEACSVRVLAAATKELSATGRVWVDIGVMRGSMVVTVVPRCDRLVVWSLASANAVAGTSINGGTRQTSNDGNGNRLLVVGAGDTRNTANVGVSESTNLTYSRAFGIGVELGGSGATGAASAQQVAYEWFMGRAESQRVVLR